MESFLSDFGVKPVLLAAQIINFLILFLILKKLLYFPVLKVLEKRKKIVSDSLENAEKIDLRLQSIEDEAAQKLSVVSRKAQKILDSASHTADEIIAKAHLQAQSDIEKMIKQAKQDFYHEQERMKHELRKEFSQLVILGVEKTADKVLDETDQKRIIENQLSELKNNF